MPLRVSVLTLDGGDNQYWIRSASPILTHIQIHVEEFLLALNRS